MGAKLSIYNCQLYDPATGAWAHTGQLHDSHEDAWRGDGMVLLRRRQSAHLLRERSQPESGREIRSSGRNMGGHGVSLCIITPFTRRPNCSTGAFWVIGGAPTPLTAEIYDPVTNSWSNTSAPNFKHERHSATLLPDGTVIVAGGIDGSTALQTVEPTIPSRTPGLSFRT